MKLLSQRTHAHGLRKRWTHHRGVDSGLIYFFKGRRRKELAWDVVSDSSIIFADDALRSEIQVTHNGRQVANPELVVFGVCNVGNVSIAADDFEQPLRFSAQTAAPILSATVVATNPPSLAPQISRPDTDITIQPLLLNRGDYLRLKVLTDGAAALHPHARIRGVPEVVRFKKSPTALTALTFLAVSLTVLWVIPVALLDDRWGNWVLFFIAPGWILLSFAGWLESRRAKRMHPVAAAA